MNPIIIAGVVAGSVVVIGGVSFVLWKKKKNAAAKKGVEPPKERSLKQDEPTVPSSSTPPLESDDLETFGENLTDGFPTPEYEPYEEIITVSQGSFSPELTAAVAFLNSLNTGDVDSCQNLMQRKIFHFILKAVKGVPVDGEVEETLPYHALSILAQILHRGFARNEQKVTVACAAEFRAANALNILYKAARTNHQATRELASILTAFVFAYVPLPPEFQSILPILKGVILNYDKNSSSEISATDPASREPERLVALALHALTLLLQHPDNVAPILENFVGRESQNGEDNAPSGRSVSPRVTSRRGFSSTSPTPQDQPGDPSSPNTNYPTDSPQPLSRSERRSRSLQQATEAPQLPLSPLQEKIFEFVSHEDKNIAAWAIRFYSAQALYMTIDEKRAFVAQTGFFDVALALLKLPLNEETLPVVQNIILAMYNLCLNSYDKGKSFILKTGIAKQLFTILVRVDFKALGSMNRGHIEPLQDKKVYIPPSLAEPLTALSPPSPLYSPSIESRYVDHQVFLMGIIEHTLAIYKSLHHNIQCLEYLVKMGVATVISNILYNYNRKLAQTIELAESSEASYGRMVGNTFELLRFLAALGVDEAIGARPNQLRQSLEKIGGIRVQENLLKFIPWDSFQFNQELEELDYTNRGLLDLAFAYIALWACDEAPDEARPVFEFINKLRDSESPLMSKESPSLYVKYYNILFKNVNNAYSF